MSTHTPGPWCALNAGLVVAAGDVKVAQADRANAYTEANARLIAAAPDLLAALKAILNVDNPPVTDPGHVDFPRAMELARAAIAKAEGRTP